MPVTTAFSHSEPSRAVADLKGQLGDSQIPKLVVFFASSKYEFRDLGCEMCSAFPKAHVVGCTTAGELANDKMLSGSVVAMFLDDEVVERAACVMVENLGLGIQLGEAFADLEGQLGEPVSGLDIHKSVGLVMADGLSGAEENLMDKLGGRTDLFFVGGSAGDDLQFRQTYVFVDGKAATNAAVLVILKLKKEFEIIKTQSFRPIGKTLTATKVDEARRQVIEFNGKPALTAYAEALGITKDDAAAHFFRHPLGLMAGDEPYVRSPQRAEGESIDFYCHIKNGTELEVLESTDLIADTRAAIESRKLALGRIGGLLHFQCILRTLQLREENQCDLYSGLFAGIPTVGFSTYGEAYLGHVNQTSTMLLFR